MVTEQTIIFAPFELDWLCKLHQSGQSIRELSRIFRRKEKIISEQLKLAGSPSRQRSWLNRPYKVNHSYFSKIDTHEKAYWLGILFSDGSVAKTNHTINLISLDESLILGFKKAVGFTGNFTLHCQPQYKRISFSSPPMKIDLTELGCTPVKSLTLEFPTKIPDQFMWSFVLGYFDGDGSIYKCGDTKQMNIISSTKFIIGLRKFLCNEGLKMGKVNSNPKFNKPETSYLRIGRRDSIKMFYDKAYANFSGALERKRIRFTT